MQKRRKGVEEKREVTCCLSEATMRNPQESFFRVYL